MEESGSNPPWTFAGFNMLDQYIEKIIKNPLFLNLKDVVENNGYHDHEVVYDHLIKTKDIAKREISGDFITNPESKKLFQEFVKEEFEGMEKAGIMIIIALLHDIGKILLVKEDDNCHPILVTNSSGITFLPGHEYWGSKVVDQLLNDLNLPSEVIKYIVNIIRLHDTYGESYWNPKKDWPWDIIINDVKSRAEGFYKEAMFNQYCDCFNAEPFRYGKEMLIKLFNEPALYIRREYVIP